MIDPQPVDEPLGDQRQHQLVGALEHLGILLAHAREIVDVEEAPRAGR